MAGDEVEDLFLLLQDVLAAHPCIRGVAVGAILSSYQRVRVEAVCARLGLTSVAYLWQRNQDELLQEMVCSCAYSRQDLHMASLLESMHSKVYLRGFLHGVSVMSRHARGEIVSRALEDH